MSLRRTSLAATAVVLAASLSACGSVLSHEETKHFDTRVDAPVKGMIAFAMPEWVPADAKDITMGVQTQGRGKNISLTSATARPAGPCEPQKQSATTEIVPTPDGWPKGTEKVAGTQCGQWRVVTAEGGRMYAWTIPGADAP
jgi:hypothetical protein